ncbi:phosphatidylglycerophosphatase A [Alphaproteobacteria bacterium]|nr:phosphatidylglycerophosphatase A [Alphaproteobacteria bacterium]
MENTKVNSFNFSKAFATFFGVGLLPFAPGTFGSLVAIPFAWVIISITNQHILFFVTIFLFILGVYSASVYSNKLKLKDPSSIVIDEVVGLCLVLSFIPKNIYLFSLAFIIFRFFDIFKPWPIYIADKKINGGIGIMIDDILAAIYTLLLLKIILMFI